MLPAQIERKQICSFMEIFERFMLAKELFVPMAILANYKWKSVLNLDISGNEEMATIVIVTKCEEIESERRKPW